MNWLKGLWAKLIKAPLAALLKPLWKTALIQVVRRGGDELQEKVRLAVVNGGPGAADKIIDDAQLKMQSLINKIAFLPESTRHSVAGIIQTWGDDLQSKIHSGFEEKGSGIVDLIFDGTQDLLIARITAL